ncbi:MAG: DNA/RNA nuclease SfsA [Dehalococcoidia bacterium]
MVQPPKLARAASALPLVEGRFVLRRNRFAADVEVDGFAAVAHVPNSGRMTELLTPGARVLLRPFPAAPARRTAYDLVMAWYHNRWVGIDARLPPAAVVEAWRGGLLPSLAGYDEVRREVRFGDSRLDLLFQGPAGLCYVEAKSVNLVEDGLALFPDAPTTRGARHLGALVEAVRQGHRAAVVFVVQRDDAVGLSPHPTADPAFAVALRMATEAGVEAHAVVCAATAAGLTPLRVAPVVLGERGDSNGRKAPQSHDTHGPGAT